MKTKPWAKPWYDSPKRPATLVRDYYRAQEALAKLKRDQDVIMAMKGYWWNITFKWSPPDHANEIAKQEAIASFAFNSLPSRYQALIVQQRLSVD